MTMNQTAMVVCILCSTFLLTILDGTIASDKFFQTGGRFGKRYNEHILDVRFTDMMNTQSVDNMPPRIERGFYISRYGKRITNPTTGPNFNPCLPSYDMHCDFTGLPNLFRCKRARPVDCSTKNYADEKTHLKADNDLFVNNY
ncbi:uncharacterized protein LOC112689957 isoform X2 [Sipha flava]|uniref:Uncharacterized protein LOC112689957 isoform X2 n=2 Tax=Sipha flava TaxID=143950 RepID=A0A8B8GA09_9HEMI|nr:uncharacterized protein LOC112689957 isoform X2 [Sipha flava]